MSEGCCMTIRVYQVKTRQHRDSFCCGNEITVGYRRKWMQHSLRGKCIRTVYTVYTYCIHSVYLVDKHYIRSVCAMYTLVSPVCYDRIAGWIPVASMDVLLFRVVCCQVAVSATRWSLIQRSTTVWVWVCVSVCVFYLTVLSIAKIMYCYE